MNVNRAQDLFRKLSSGVSAIDDLFAAPTSEELFLEFKRSADGGAGAALHASDRTNLTESRLTEWFVLRGNMGYNKAFSGRVRDAVPRTAP
jgi:hypothetical protein